MSSEVSEIPFNIELWGNLDFMIFFLQGFALILKCDSS